MIIRSYIEPVIQRQILLIQFIYSHPGCTVSEISEALNLSGDKIRRIIDIFRNDSTLNCTFEAKKVTLHNDINTIVKYNSALYHSSVFLNYLFFVLNNTEEVSIVQMQQNLQLSSSSIYKAHKKVAEFLQRNHLKLQKNIVYGDEFTKRMLLALLASKYNFHSQFETGINQSLLKHLLFKHHLIKQTKFSLDYNFFLALTIVGMYRLQYQNQIASLQDMMFLRNLDFYHDSQQFITEYFATLGQQNRLSQKSLDYFAYATLFLPHYNQQLLEKYDDYIYHIQPYTQLEEQIVQILPPAFDSWGVFRKDLMIHIFRNTLNHKDLFIEKPELEFSYISNEDVNPIFKQVIERLFYTCFKRTINDELITSVVIYLQNLLYSHCKFKLGLILINGDDIFEKYLQSRINSEYQRDNYRIQKASTIKEVNEIRKNNDASIILAPPFSLVTIKEQFVELTQSPHLIVIPVTFMNLNLAFTNLQTASQKLKKTLFYEMLTKRYSQIIE
ncbi:helix-turn-helix domain-containing protein [Ligilactobacillus equi]|uniref:helix-turn-helix domain-containing protein n=1 Tax=Ligilactobacillus equi TaxID=137357 RepID=UPI002ED53544